MKRLVAIAALVLVAGVLAASASAAGGSKCPCLISAKGPAFPVQTYILSLPRPRTLTINDVNVTENGTSVVDPTLVPASQASKETFGVVLVLDTSYSMTGKPIRAAIAAEQAFVAQRNPNEQIGAIDFNRTEQVVLPLTTSDNKISSALVSPPHITSGTHIFDAVARAETMLTAAHINSGSIVVLSDGADTGSTKPLEQVATAARRANARIDAVGLKDRVYKPGTLRALAAEGNGAYAQAKTPRLAPLFAQLSRQLSNEYVLRYTSVASPNKPVLVKVQVKGVGVARVHYRTPALPLTSARVRP